MNVVIIYKELIETNTVLLEQKHELEYKLNKTNELSEQQIKDLEETVDNYNQEMNLIKSKKKSFWTHILRMKNFLFFILSISNRKIRIATEWS